MIVVRKGACRVGIGALQCRDQRRGTGGGHDRLLVPTRVMGVEMPGPIDHVLGPARFTKELMEGLEPYRETVDL